MNSELLQMQAAIRVIGEAVADMAKVCEGLPRLFDIKLAAFRTEMAASLGEVKEATSALLEKQAAGLAEVQASQATLTGQFAAQQGAAQAALADAVAGVETRTAQIIADNVKAVAESISGCETLLREGLDTVRKECDPATLAAALQVVEGRVALLDEEIQGKHSDISKISDRINNVVSNVAHAQEHIDTVSSRVDNVEDGVAAAKTNTAQLLAEVDEVRKDINQHATEQGKLFTDMQASVLRRVSSVSEAVAELTKDLASARVDATARIDEVRGTVTTLREYVESDITDQLAAVAGQAQKAESIALDKLVELEQRVGAVDERVSNVDASHVTHTAGVRDELMAVVTAAGERFASDIVATEERITCKVSDAAVGLLELSKRVDDETAAIRVEYRAGLVDLRDATTKDVEATLQRLSGVETRVIQVADTYVKAEDAQRSLDSIVVNVENVTKQVDELGQQVATNHSTLRTQLAGVQESVVALQAEPFVRGKDLQPMAANIEAVTRHAEELQGDLTGHKAGVAVSIASIGAALNDKVDVSAMDKALAEETRKINVTLTTNIQLAKNQIDELAQRVDDAKAAFVSSLVASNQNIGETIDALECSLRADFGDDVKALRTDLDVVHAAAKEGLAKKADASAVERIVETVNGAIVQVNSASVARTGELADEIKVTLDSLDGRVKELATQTSSALAVVEGKVAEIQPVQNIEVPELQMAAEYDDGHVTLSFVCGDQTAAVAIPVDIGVQYRGIWEQSSKAKPGDIFTHKGSMWICKAAMAGEPGKDFTGWQLAVKRGSDGKDGHSPMAYEDHKSGRTYKSGDFLRLNNRLWQCGVSETKSVPEPSDIATTRQWILIGGAQ